MSAGPVNFEYAETPVTATTSSAGHATPAELVKIADGLWRRVRESKVAAADAAANEALLADLQAEFHDFNLSFPLVVRWMVQLRKYSPRAFEKYLLKHASAKLDSRRAFLELQAEYLVLLRREEIRHPDERLMKAYRDGVVKSLVEEDEAFMAAQKECERELAARGAANDMERRRALYERLTASRPGA